MEQKKKKNDQWLVVQKVNDKYINSIVVNRNITLTSSNTVIDARVWTSKELEDLYKNYPLGQEGFDVHFTLVEYK